LTKEEIAQNETQWKEENVDEDQYLSASSELRGAGITANNMSGDLGSLSAPTPEPNMMDGEDQGPAATATPGGETGTPGAEPGTVG
jgi:hypothetical protein